MCLQSECESAPGKMGIGKRIESGGYLGYKFTVAESLGGA
jgi:hypothetical protein